MRNRWGRFADLIVLVAVWGLLPPDPARPSSIQSRFPYPRFGTLIRLTQDAANSTVLFNCPQAA